MLRWERRTVAGAAAKLMTWGLFDKVDSGTLADKDGVDVSA